MQPQDGGDALAVVEMERPERWCDVRSADSSLTALGLPGLYSPGLKISPVHLQVVPNL